MANPLGASREVILGGILDKAMAGQSLAGWEEKALAQAGGPEGLSELLGMLDEPEPTPEETAAMPREIAEGGGIMPPQLDPYEIVPPRLSMPSQLDPNEVVPDRVPWDRMLPEGAFGMSDFGTPIEEAALPPQQGGAAENPDETLTFGLPPYDSGDPDWHQNALTFGPMDEVDPVVTELHERDRTGTIGTMSPSSATRTEGSEGPVQAGAGLADDAASSKNWLQRILRPDDEDDRRSMAMALMSGGHAMATTPGDALTGLSHGLNAGMEGYYGTQDLTDEQARKDSELDMKRELMDLRREEAAAARRGDALAEEEARLSIRTKELALEQAQTGGSFDAVSPLGKIISDVEEYAQDLMRAGVPREEAVARARSVFEGYKDIFDPEAPNPMEMWSQ